MPGYDGVPNGVVGNGVHRADTLAKSVKETPEGKAAKTAVKQHTSWTSNVPVDTQVYGEKTIECSDGMHMHAYLGMPCKSFTYLPTLQLQPCQLC